MGCEALFLAQAVHLKVGLFMKMEKSPFSICVKSSLALRVLCRAEKVLPREVKGNNNADSTVSLKHPNTQWKCLLHV